MNYCLDSNIVIDLFRGDGSLKSQLEKCEHYCITPVVLCELFKGAYLADRQQDALKLVEDFIHSCELLEFNEYACKIFGQQYARLKRLGKMTQEADLMIASITIAHSAVLVTRNPADFINIQGLKMLALDKK